MQIESIAAGPLRILRAGADPIEFRFNAWETTSPAWLLALLTVVGLMLVGLVVVASGRRLVSPEITPETADAIVVAASVLIIGLLIVSGKVFSPQYLLWLIAPLAVTCALRTDQDRWLFGLMAATCALTTLVYPVLYFELTAGEALPWAALQLRNLLLVVAVGILAFRWRKSLIAQPQRASQSTPART